MCTYQTTSIAVTGSGKGAEGWFALSDVSIYFDHPVHAPADHTLNIDLLNPARGPSFRVALELDPASARALAEAILENLATAPLSLVAATASAAAGGSRRSGEGSSLTAGHDAAGPEKGR